MWTFYFGPNPISLASHIALHDAGAEVALRRMDMGAGAHQQGDYAKLNPKLRVPTLVTERGALTETPAILAFVAQRFPEKRLAPLSDPFAFAKFQEFNLYIAATLHVAHAHRMRGHRWVDAGDADAIRAMRAKVPESVGACFRYIEETYLDGPFVLGAEYTLADPYLLTVARWMEGDGLDVADFPKVASHRTMMLERETVQRALAEEAG